MKQPLIEHARSWFALTDNERIALASILALFLFGLAVRYWTLRRERVEPAAPVRVDLVEPRR